MPNPHFKNTSTQLKKVSKMTTISQEQIETQEAQIELQALATSDRKRNLSIFMDQAIYMLGVKVRVGRTKQKILWEDLNLSPALIEKLRKGGADSPSIKLCDTQQRVSNAFAVARNKVYRYMVYSDPYWFIQERNIVVATAAVRDLYAECDRQRSIVLGEYDSARSIYYLRVQEIIQAANLPDADVEQVIGAYMDKFPSRQQMYDSISVSIDGPVRVPSIMEQVTEESELAIALAQKATAENTLTEAAAISELQYNWRKNIKKGLSDAVTVARDEITLTITDCLSKLEASAEVGRHSNRTRESIQKALERIEVLGSFNNELTGAVTDLTELAQLATRDTTGLKARLAALKSQVGDCVDMVNNTGTGHAALAQFMIE
jgi:hypothetical protein